MLKHVERMLIEKKDLEGKIKKAKKAIQNPPYGMNKKQIVMLADQVEAMEDYLSCLKARLDYENDNKRDEL